MVAKVIAVCKSEKKQTKKVNVGDAYLKENYGIVGDAHGEFNTHRQVSLLAIESINKMRELGLNVKPGDFAENLTTEGIDLTILPLGTKLLVGKEVILEVTQIGKECHTRCAIYYQAGDCIMPKEGIFARVIKGGTIKTGDKISLSAGLNSISKTINHDLIPQINYWNIWIDKNRSIFQNYGKFWKKFEEEYKIAEKEAIECLKKYHWFITPSLPIDFVYNAVKICKRSGNQIKLMNKLFIDYFSDDDFTGLENMVESWKDKEIFKPRMKILRDCVLTLKESSSNCNASNLIIPTLITQIDGIQRDFMGKNDLRVTRQGLMGSDSNVLVDENGDKIYWKDWYGNLTTDDEILDSANDIFLNILFQKSQTGEPLETPFTFSRHKILHGGSIRYGRKTNTIRAFLILDFLASLIEEQT